MQTENKEQLSEQYPEFAKVCLAHIILFNRKRSGEAQRMTVQKYKMAKKGGRVDPVVMSVLTELEKKLCQTHLRVEIRGKKGRKVPVLFTKDMQQNIEMLLKMRSAAGVSDDGLLFATPQNEKNPYRGTDALRKMAKSCGMEDPSLITSTNLRKQLATLAQILNLKENSQDLLATFQGHDIRIHREYYRLPENVLQVAKMSKVLRCINNGTINKFSGCDFEDITFNPDGKFFFLPKQKYCLILIIGPVTDLCVSIDQAYISENTN
jgi:integrase